MILASSSWAPVWSLVFCGVLLLYTLSRYALSYRQLRHVARHRHQVPTAFAEHITLAAHQKAADYTLAKLRLDLLELPWHTALLVGWTLLGGLHTLNQMLLVWMGPGLAQQIALLAGFFVVSSVLELPWGWYRTFQLEARFGFNRSSLGLWLSDQAKGLLLGAVLGLPLATALLWLMNSTGPTWWLWGWGLWAGFNLLLLVLYPTVIAPLFNQFQPLTDVTLRTRIEALLQRSSLRAQGIYVMDGSKRSTHANAYFTGLGPAKRVVFFDTLLAQLTPTQIDAVLAHELGHLKHRHIMQRVGVMLVASGLGFALLGWLIDQPWFYLGLGVIPNLDSANSALALLLLLISAPLFTFFTTPLFSHQSRQHEFEADAYAAQHSSANDLRAALLKLYQDNASTLTPDPWYARFYYSHPPAHERLARLNIPTA